MADSQLFPQDQQFTFECCARPESTQSLKAEADLCQASQYLGLGKDDWVCGRQGKRMRVEGLLTAGVAVLCPKHVLYFEQVCGYRVEVE